ncbi:MAG TPA: hypothetical protein VIC30_05335 [Orrella sp.]
MAGFTQHRLRALAARLYCHAVLSRGAVSWFLQANHMHTLSVIQVSHTGLTIKFGLVVSCRVLLLFVLLLLGNV